MRAKALKIGFIAALVLGAPSGFASTAKPVAHKPQAASRTPVKSETVSHVLKPAPTKVASAKAGKPKQSPLEPKSHKPEPKVAAQHEKPALTERRAAPAAAPEQAPEDDSIEVTHDRKRHLTSQGGVSQATPRKATSADFLTSFSASAPAPAKRKPAPAPVKPPVPKAVPTEAPAAIVPVLYTKRGRLVVPPPMKGSHDILLHQNEMADRDGLDRVQDDADLEQMRDDKSLVPIPVGQGLVVDERLPANRRYSRPWTAQFLTALSRAYYARFHTPLQVNSAVRTVEFQQRLLMTNGNAAPAEGETASPHLTGQAVDLAKHGLSLTQIAWLRGYLLPLVQAGKVDVEEEFQQACFHISVYRKYVPQPAPKREIAGTHAGTGTTLATAIQ